MYTTSSTNSKPTRSHTETWLEPTRSTRYAANHGLYNDQHQQRYSPSNAALNYLDLSARRPSYTQSPSDNSFNFGNQFAAAVPNHSGSSIDAMRYPSNSHDQDSAHSEDDLDEDGEDQSTDGGPMGSHMSAADSATQKKRMKRFRLTHSQTRYLVNEFIRQPHPNAAHREHLSQAIPGLSPRQVQVWFQNRRAKMKRLAPEDRERVLRSRTLPDGFESSHTLPAGAVSNVSEPREMQNEYSMSYEGIITETAPPGDLVFSHAQPPGPTTKTSKSGLPCDDWMIKPDTRSLTTNNLGQLFVHSFDSMTEEELPKSHQRILSGIESIISQSAYPSPPPTSETSLQPNGATTQQDWRRNPGQGSLMAGTMDEQDEHPHTAYFREEMIRKGQREHRKESTSVFGRCLVLGLLADESETELQDGERSEMNQHDYMGME